MEPRLLLIAFLLGILFQIRLLAQTSPTSLPATAQSVGSNEEEPDPRDNEVAVDLSPLAAAPASTQPGDPGFVLRIGPDRFAGTNLSHPDFSPDGREVVVTNIADTRIFDVATGRLVATLPSALETRFADADRLVQRLFEDIHVIDRTGAILQTINVHRPEKIAISRDGTRLAIATAWVRSPPNAHAVEPEPNVTLWNLKTGEQVADLGPVFHKTEPVRGQANAFWLLDNGTSIGFDSAQTLMTIAADGHVKLWDATTGQPKSCADIVIDPAVPATLAPDSKSILLADTTAKQIDVSTGGVSPLPIQLPSPTTPVAATRPSQLRRTLSRSRPGTIYGRLQFSPDGRVVSFLMRGVYHRWNLQTRQELPLIDRSPGGLDAVSSPDGKSVAVVSFGVLDLVDGDTGKSRFPPSAPESPVRSLIVTRDGAAMFIADQGESIYRFDLSTGALQAWRKRVKRPALSLLPAEGLALSPTNDAIWSFGFNSTMTPRDSRTLAPIDEPIAISLEPPYAVSADGTTAAGNSSDGGYEFISLAAPTSQPVSIQTLGTNIRRSSVLALSPDHQHIAIADPYLLSILRSDPSAPDAVVRQYFSTPSSRSGEMPADAKVIQLPASFACNAIRYSPDGRFIVGITHDGPIAFDADLTVRWLVKDPTTNSQGRPMCLSDDGQLMAYSNPSGIAIVDTDDGRAVVTLPINSTNVRLLEFIPGTTRLIVLHDGRVIDIWDWRTIGEKSLAANVHTEPAADLIGSDQPAKAYLALFTFMQHPADLLKMAANLDEKTPANRYQTWIAGLSSNDSAERERCHHELERAGAGAAADIRRALSTATPGEAHDRLQALSDLLNDVQTPDDDDGVKPADASHRRAARIIEALDWTRSPQARDALQNLSKCADGDVAALANIALKHNSRVASSQR